MEKIGHILAGRTAALALLKTAWLITLLRPWHGNLNKRVIKSPKL